jgi:hypothetical protein
MVAWFIKRVMADGREVLWVEDGEESQDANQGFGLSSLPRFDVPSAEGIRRRCSSQKGSGAEAESIEWWFGHNWRNAKCFQK